MKYPASTVQARHDSPLGCIILAASGSQLVGLWFDGQRHQPDTSRWPEASAHPVLQQAKAQLSDYFAGRRRSFDLPLDLGSGTPFQQAVWRALLEIPDGTSVTYGALSAALGRPTAVRAVAGAIAQNPLSIIVPCHRVLGAGGGA